MVTKEYERVLTVQQVPTPVYNYFGGIGFLSTDQFLDAFSKMPERNINGSCCLSSLFGCPMSSSGI